MYEAWVARYNGPGNFDDDAYALAVDDSGNVYVTGSNFGSGGSYDYATIKYAPNGDTLWVRRFNGPGNSADQASALAVDISGNIYVTGYSDGLGSFNDYVTIKYSSCFGKLSGFLSDDDKLNITDLVYLVNILFKSWPIPGPTCLADVNGDSFVTMADVIYLAYHVFKFGPAPVKAGPCCD